MTMTNEEVGWNNGVLLDRNGRPVDIQEAKRLAKANPGKVMSFE